MPQYESTTDQLVSVIHSIQARRRSGLLIASRGEGINVEEGTIAFVNGHVTQASVERRSGSEALNWLSTWGKCRFTFVPSTVSGATQPFSPVSPNTARDLPSDTAMYPHRQTPPLDRQSGSRQSGPLELGERREIGMVNNPARTPGAPYRTQHLDDALRRIEQRGLSRAHRFLLFWINGSRPIPELVHLVRCSEEKVCEMLRDLERIGVIQVPDASTQRETHRQQE